MMFSIGALSFASPAILAALVALPAIWFLLRATPPAPRRVRFPAFVILRQLQTADVTPDRTPWWLLALRLLLAALAILGLAGPVLNEPPATDASGPLVFVVDDTWAAAASWRLRSDALRAGAEEAAAGDRQAFVVTTADPKSQGSLAPMAGGELRRILETIRPRPFQADREGARRILPMLDGALAGHVGRPEFRWLSDGLGGDGDAALARDLAARGALTIFSEPSQPLLTLRALPARTDNRAFRVERLRGEGAQTADVAAMARNGRELARAAAALDAGATSADVEIALPLALRNEVSAVLIDGVASAGAVQLSDARERRALVGMVDGAKTAGDELVTGDYYVRKALAPYAEVIAAPLDELLKSDVSAVVLDDIGRLRPGDADSLRAWIEQGGVAIRFAGSNLADAAQDGDPPLLPVKLRGGGRAFGGALTWDTPQRLGAFSPSGPFMDLVAPADIFVREQVLAAPGGDTGERTWASLADGTPIITGVKIGSGALALFHVPATPGWSDLPISGTFVELLRRLVYLSILGPDRNESEPGAGLAPIRVLDGFGRFERPSADARSITAAEAMLGAAPGRPPGFYGAPDAPVAVNAVAPGDIIAPLEIAGAKFAPYVADPPFRLGAPLIAAALMLLVLDGLVTLLLSGNLRPATIALLAFVLAPANRAEAQPVDAPIDATVAGAALTTRLAYVRTGDPEIDRLSERGLAALTLELIRRTAVEPAAPVAVDPEIDDLSVYPLLYWPIALGATAPSERALANIENFMRFGGLAVFDTRDDERAIPGVETPERAALREILRQIDVPPLTPLPKDHVLTRSFYLLNDLPGRTGNQSVWVQAEGSANDGVTPLIIGGRDWAGAWATDDFGRPLRPVTGRGDCGENTTVQECAVRAGINIAMVAYTGNYKADQVHTPILLQRLGR